MMVDYSKELVSALKTILPTHYEMELTAREKVPCISYLELNNAATDTGDTIGYSELHTKSRYGEIRYPFYNRQRRK